MDTSALTSLRFFRRDRDMAFRAAASFCENADMSNEEDRYCAELMRQKAEYTAWCYCHVLSAAMSCLSALPSQSLEYKVLYHRYILGRKWERIADDMYYCDRHIKRIGKRGLEELRRM